MARVDERTRIEHRKRLLDAAASEFAAKGLDGARVDDISIAAGLAKGTIYNYFDSKRDVFRAVVAEWARRIGGERRTLPPEAPVREHLLAVASADMRVTAEIEEFARAAFREALTAPPDLFAEILRAWDPLDAVVERIMERAQLAGEVGLERTPRELAKLFMTVVNGLLLEHWLPKSTVGLDDIPELAVDLYLHGVSAGSRS